MKEPLGNILFAVGVGILFLCGFMYFVVGWILFGISLVLPRTQPTIYRMMDFGDRILRPVAKYAAIVTGILFLIYFLASILGWGPPLPPGEPGDDEDPRACGRLSNMILPFS